MWWGLRQAEHSLAGWASQRKRDRSRSNLPGPEARAILLNKHSQETARQRTVLEAAHGKHFLGLVLKLFREQLLHSSLALKSSPDHPCCPMVAA